MQDEKAFESLPPPITSGEDVPLDFGDEDTGDIEPETKAKKRGSSGRFQRHG